MAGGGGNPGGAGGGGWDGGHGRVDVQREVEGVLDRFLGLEAAAGDEGDDQLVGGDLAAAGELVQAGDDDAARGLGEDALGLGEQA